MEEAGSQTQAPTAAGCASSAAASPTSASTLAPIPASTPSANFAPTPSAAGSSSASKLFKRSRSLGLVTPTACAECRKMHAKCDGKMPCSRCSIQKNIKCAYEIPVRQSKKHLRAEIEQLRDRQQCSDQVIAAIACSDMWEDVLQQLRNDQCLKSVSEWLGAALPSGGGQRTFNRPTEQTGDANTDSGTSAGLLISTPAPARIGDLGGPRNVTLSPTLAQANSRQDADSNSPWRLSSRSHSVGIVSHPDLNRSAVTNSAAQESFGTTGESISDAKISKGGSEYQVLDQVLIPLELPGINLASKDWSDITDDSALVRHLLDLYFCWEYPVFAPLSKEHFLSDFQNGIHRYCSPILVNALLALGCCFSSHTITLANPNSPLISGDNFFREAQRLIDLEEDHHSLTTVQALGIMSIREASYGRDSTSCYYTRQSIRLAVEMGLHQLEEDGDDDKFAVQVATFWGAFALDQPAIIDATEASLWMPYPDDGVPLQRSAKQPSNVRSVYKCFCELSELVHHSLYILHTPGRLLNSHSLLGIYTQYLDWYIRIPQVLRLGLNYTPAVLFLHMYYHFAVLLLFRPLIKLKIIGSKLLPRDICKQAADAIQGLLRSYSQLYTLRRTPSFLPYFALTAAVMHLAVDTPSTAVQRDYNTLATASADPPAQMLTPSCVAEAITQGIRDLEEMAPCHHFAERSLDILRYLTKKWNMDINMCEGPTWSEEHGHLVRPHTSSLYFFAPNHVENESTCARGSSGDKADGLNPKTATGTKGAETRKPLVVQTDTVIDNPFFWPFPMAGRPILPTEGGLEEAGFEKI
ncbi:fungal-specific transcription factor [Colletotrichum godetiae]|uniref:Fungal-specific transcription factor n=1 Tax=Colletotrichum godetiae TaxID=1209918 RepID=A0AAJ0ABG0_9PEZI|nr:fungal-specific transcription factor [Colletotrichum godetiae]KAK1658526.1 fungal-specific transcription factor [Colletotrichum godetiae]